MNFLLIIDNFLLPRECTHSVISNNQYSIINNQSP